MRKNYKRMVSKNKTRKNKADLHITKNKKINNEEKVYRKKVSIKEIFYTLG